MDKMFKLNTVLKIVFLLYNDCFQGTANQVRSSLSLCLDVVAACRLTLSKQLNKLRHTGGDRSTQPLKFEQQQMHTTKMETTTSKNYYRTKAVLVILMQYCN